MTEGGTIHEVLRALGRLESKVGALDEKIDAQSEDLREDRDNARDSRARLHERLDEHAKLIAAIQTDIKIGAGIDAQVRGELDALTREVEPVTKHVKTLKWIGAGLAGSLGLSGVTMAFAADAVRSAFKSWLG